MVVEQHGCGSSKQPLCHDEPSYLTGTACSALSVGPVCCTGWPGRQLFVSGSILLDVFDELEWCVRGPLTLCLRVHSALLARSDKLCSSRIGC